MKLHTTAWHEVLLGAMAIVGLIGFVGVMVGMLVLLAT